MVIVFLAILGAVIGSFIGALTWRWPRNESIFDGRSRCPNCHHKIHWYDNIPLVSYLVLSGRCRACKKKIPLRDFLIEFSVAILLPIFYISFPLVQQNIPWVAALPFFTGFVAYASLAVLGVAIFIVDLEHQYIPDRLVLFMLLIILGLFILQNINPVMYVAAGLGSSVFLLLIHLATRGGGMGLGDVKLVLALGTILGFPLAVVSMFGAFVVGSIFGITLIILGKAKLKQKVAFGPFLVLGFFIASHFGNLITTYFYF